MGFYFYCPNCGFEEIADKLPRGTCPNLRDGFGTPINHYECRRCGNLDAGFMRFGMGKMDELPEGKQEEYFRSVIKMYQNIRGIKDRKL